MTDYEKLYAEQDGVCGDPFPDFIRFFDDLPAGASVLDLGCGQGRDALMAARRGHRVLGVDLSATGVHQMVETARAEGLAVEGVVADVVDFEPDGRFEVALLDRVLHMLSDDDARRRVLARLCEAVEPRGHLLLADTPKHLPMIQTFMTDQGPRWTCTFARKGFMFWRRLEPDSNGASARRPE